MPRQSHAVSGNYPVRNRRRHHRLAAAAGLLVAALLIAAPVAFSAQAAVGLGTTDSFAVLAGSTVTNTGPSVISGSVGLDPGSAVTGFPPGIVLAGTTQVADGVALQAKSDLVTAYNDAAGRSSTATVSGDLAGRTLTPGVYTSASSLGLSGALTLDAQGNPNAVFVFQAGSTLIVGSSSQVNLIGGAQACNVYWQVGSSATIGTASAFVGNILALTSITMTTGATLNGRALARNGAVTLDTNTITRPTLRRRRHDRRQHPRHRSGTGRAAPQAPPSAGHHRHHRRRNKPKHRNTQAQGTSPRTRPKPVKPGRRHPKPSEAGNPDARQADGTQASGVHGLRDASRPRATVDASETALRRCPRRPGVARGNDGGDGLGDACASGPDDPAARGPQPRHGGVQQAKPQLRVGRRGERGAPDHR